jgi:signal peptidase
MRVIRFLGNVALWLGAVLGVIAGGVWVAGQFGVLHPLIVISGSMEPGIGTGDLLVSRNLATADVEVGDVVTLHSEMTDKLVTHRVIEVSPNPEGTWEIMMKGDANDEPDLEVYTVGDSVLTPAVQIPGGGKVVSKMMEPAVALPVLLSLVALLGLSLLDEPKRIVVRRTEQDAVDPIADLDAMLASVGIDVNDLDAALASLGIDVDDLPAIDREPERLEQPDDERELVMSG